MIDTSDNAAPRAPALFVRFGMPPGDFDLPEIRSMLDGLIALEPAHSEPGTPADPDNANHEVILLLTQLLFAAARLDDVVRIWRAKRSSFDLGSYLDVQLLCGAGLRPTLDFLDCSKEREEQDALQYLQASMAAGDFEGFDPVRQLEFYRQYWA
ncbi:MAG: hypothetical protein GY926_23270 [bacterium]|nr:hypothetical protein [bacterium]